MEGRNSSFSIVDVLVRCRPPFVGGMDVVERDRVTFTVTLAHWVLSMLLTRVGDGTSFAVVVARCMLRVRGWVYHVREMTS